MPLSPDEEADVRLLEQKRRQYALNIALGNLRARERSAQELALAAGIVTMTLLPAEPSAKENAA